MKRKRRFAVRTSPIHGMGVFALCRIPKGVRLIEYKGLRRKWADTADDGGPCTYIFGLEDGLVIDPSVGGNSARFINHSCAPNCEAVLDGGRVYIETIRPIRPGEELSYDYALALGRRPSREDHRRHACGCDSRACRGTMLNVSLCGRQARP